MYVCNYNKRCISYGYLALINALSSHPPPLSRRPDGGGVVCDLGGLEEKVLFLFERFEIGVEAFEQGEHPFFAVVDLLSDLLSGAFDPVDLDFHSGISNGVDVGDFGNRRPRGVSLRHSTPYPTTADLRLVSGAGEWLATCRTPLLVGHI